VLQVFLPYERYVRWLKWLTLSLFAYVAVVLTLRIDWVAVARAVVWPQLTTDHQVFLTVVAVLGTTISPYLFFWQASQEVEDKKPGVHSAEEVRLSPAAHPHRHGDRHGLSRSWWRSASCWAPPPRCTPPACATSRPPRRRPRRCGRWRATSPSWCSAWHHRHRHAGGAGAGGLGRLCRGGRRGLARQPVANAAARRGTGLLQRDRGVHRGRVILCFTPTTAIEELFWSAVINGVVAVPIMAVLMRLASRPDVMGEHVIGRRVRWLGWLATACMALPVIGLALTWKS
jgi:hypothetical protein